MKKGVNKIENQGEKWYKLLQKCQMTDFCAKLSLELNVIETNRFFLQKEGVSKIAFGIKKGPCVIEKCQKGGSIEWKFPTIFKYVSAPPGS